MMAQITTGVGTEYLQLLQRSFRRSPRLLSLFLALAALMILLSTLIPPGNAQSNVTRAQITEVVDGSQVFIENQPAKLNAVATIGQQVRTGKARVELTFNTGAIGRLENNSALTINSSCSQLQRGQVLIEGAINGCTRFLVTRVRGTVYVMEVNQSGQERVVVFDGEVAVRRAADPNKPAATDQIWIVKPGEQIVVNPDGQVQQVRRLSQQEYDLFLMGPLFLQFTRDLRNIALIRRYYQRLFPGNAFPLDLRPRLRPRGVTNPTIRPIPR